MSDPMTRAAVTSNGLPPEKVAPTAERPVAVFDLDGTLTTRSTFLPFLLGFERRWATKSLVLPLLLAAYGARLLKDYRLKEELLKRFLGGVPIEAVEDQARRFCEAWLPRHIHPVGHRLLRGHQQAGHRVILLSASPDLYVPAIAKRLGIEETLCTRVRTDGGRCLGTLAGPNCKGENKLRALQAHLGRQRPPSESFAYGDSRHDRPVLSWVRWGYFVGRRRAVPLGEPPARGRPGTESPGRG